MGRHDVDGRERGSGLVEGVFGIFGSGRLLERRVAPFNPHRIRDPRAREVEWTILGGGCRDFRTRVLKDEGPDRLVFRDAGLRAAHLLAAGMGLVLLVSFLTIAWDGVAGGVQASTFALVLLFFGIFAVAGGILFVAGWDGLRRGTPVLVFDGRDRIFWRGSPGGAGSMDPHAVEITVPFDEIVALQLLREHCRTTESSFDSYELNLVLGDNRRVHLLAHSVRARMREESGRLARFLDKPLWDATR